MGKKVLVLGGGAPNFTLMSGALLALHKAGVRFDVIYMNGAGAVVGLLYLAPKYLTTEQSLENTVNFGISDPIYSICPINYKLFNKGGRSAEAFRRYWTTLPPVRIAMNQYGMGPAEKLWSDALLFMGAMLSPTDVHYFSEGICANVPFIENVVDFDKLKTVPTECYLGAYCIEDRQMEQFDTQQIDVDHFRAALSFPFVYPPYRIGAKHYYEGAAVDCLNLVDFMVKKLRISFTDRKQDFETEDNLDQDFDKIVLFDVMRPFLIHRPRNLWDAYAQSIIVPLVANAEKELAMFLNWVKTGYRIKLPPHDWDWNLPIQELPPQQESLPALKPYVIHFSIPDEHLPRLLDWSSSNLERLFDVGYQAGRTFVEAYGDSFGVPNPSSNW